jgi:hypothetical protein
MPEVQSNDDPGVTLDPWGRENIRGVTVPIERGRDLGLDLGCGKKRGLVGGKETDRGEGK